MIIREDIPPPLTDEVKARIVPALKHKDTGHLIGGRRGEDHEDILVRRDIMHEYPKWSHGFYDPKTKKFMHSHSVDIDAPDLMTRSQRMRKYGVERKSHTLNVLHELEALC
jgi:hypothetical protein